MDVGALSLLIGESGFAATMEKIAQVDAAAARVGTRQAAVRVEAPTAPTAAAAINRVREALDAIARPVVIGAPFDALVTGAAPATRAVTALAEAQASQAARAAALTQALERAAAAEATTAQRAQILKTALDQEQASTDALSAATRQLDITQRDGIAIIALRARAINELREAQNQLSRASNVGTTRVRAEPLGTPAPNIAAGPELGPATRAAEAFAQRSAATKAAFEAEAAAARQAALANATYATNTARAGAETEKLSPRVRSAANGIATLAFTLTASEPNFQTFALGAGLVGSSLADAFGSAKMAAYASGIGAVLVVAGTFVGVLERMSDRAAKASTAVDDVVASIRGMRSASEARAALTVATRDLARAEARLREEQSRNTGEAGTLASSIAGRILRIRTLQKEVEQLNQILAAARHQVAVNEITEATELARARREIVVEGVAAEARARDAAQQAQLAREEAQFATGRSNLQRFYDARLAFIRDSAAREIAVLRARQNALAAPDPDATPADSAKRAAEVARINTQIAEINNRTQQQATEALEQRRQQRESLDRQILQFEQREADAAGDASEQRIQQARLEAREIARAFVQRSGATTPEQLEQAWSDANAAAQQYVDTQTTVIRAQQQQQAAQRIFNGLEIERLTIQQQLARGDITQAEANQRLAAAERARIDDLVAIATEMERFGRELNNPDLINAARRLRTEINGLANAPLGPLAQRIKALRDALSVAAEEGDASARQILRRLDEIRANGQPITLSVILEAEWERELKRQIDEGLARQEFIIKPKNIILSGVGEAIDQLNNEFSGLALNVGNAIGSSLSAGFSAAFTKGSGKTFAEAFGNALLSSVGSVMVQLGSAMLAYAAIMTVAAPLLALTPFAGAAIGAGQAAITGAALIALGAGMGAIAANNTGSRTGGGRASGGRASALEIPVQRVVLDPDRRLREREALGTRVAVGSGLRAAAPLPLVRIGTLAALNPNDPLWQRNVTTAVEKGIRRSIGSKR